MGDRWYPAGRIGEQMPHANHPAIIRRLKRADDHLQTIIEMTEQGRPCSQIAQQMQAVESAIEMPRRR
jgi:DNA-binding FrmR family transcriptional regulator